MNMRKLFVLLFVVLSFTKANAEELGIVEDDISKVENDNRNISVVYNEIKDNSVNNNEQQSVDVRHIDNKQVRTVKNGDQIYYVLPCNGNQSCESELNSILRKISSNDKNKTNSKVSNRAKNDDVVNVDYDKLLHGGTDDVNDNKNNDKNQSGFGFRMGGAMNFGLYNMQFIKNNADSFMVGFEGYADLIYNTNSFFNPFVGVVGGVSLYAGESVEKIGDNDMIADANCAFNVGVRIGNNFFSRNKKIGTSIFGEFGKHYIKYQQYTKSTEKQAMRSGSYMMKGGVYYLPSRDEKLDGYYFGGGVDFNFHFVSFGFFYHRTQIVTDKMYTTLNGSIVNFNSMFAHVIGARFGVFFSV